MPNLVQLLPILQAFVHHPEPQVSKMASLLRVSIVTTLTNHGEPIPSTAAPPTDTATTTTSAPAADTAAAATTTPPTTLRGFAEVSREMATALAEVRDPIIAVRAGGLHRIRRLVRKKLPAMEPRVNDVFELLLGQLHESDSYVFLGAVAALSTLCDVYPGQVWHEQLFIDHS